LKTIGSCLDYPDDWKDKTWKSSYSGGTDITFTNNVTSGIGINIVGSGVNRWTCFLIKNDMVVSR